jgi:hypothetical protein
MEVKVLNGQSLFDLAIQVAGSVEAVFDIALANGISITDELRPGTVLTIPAVVGRQVADYYAANGICPATALSASDEMLLRNGVEFWALEFDFAVS